MDEVGIKYYGYEKGILNAKGPDPWLIHEDEATLTFASPMHDIGKIGIPDRVLLKKGPLDPEEWEIMKGHAAMGAEILGNSKSPYLQMGAEIALNHH